MRSERLPRFSLIVATLVVVAMTGVLALRARRGVAPLGDLLAVLPALWLWAAAMLSRDDPGHAAYAVSTAGLFGALLSVALLFQEARLYAGMPPPVGMLSAEKLLVLTQFPIALTALVPATIGWWQRRPDRLADPDPDA